MVIEPHGEWEHNAYQSDTQFVVEVKPLREDPSQARAAARSTAIAARRLSLNFQNIDVRALLQVIADFTNLNIVTSDSVAGNLTLRLKDVPWDQALDIILQSKGLDMRKNGNVILVAPRDELAAKEKLELEARAQIAEIEPVRTETFQLNYQKAEELHKLLSDEKQRVLSKRGSVVVDERTNKVFVQDTASRLEDVRQLIAADRRAGAPGADRGAHRRGRRPLLAQPRRAARLQRRPVDVYAPGRGTDGRRAPAHQRAGLRRGQHRRQCYATVSGNLSGVADLSSQNGTTRPAQRGRHRPADGAGQHQLRQPAGRGDLAASSRRRSRSACSARA